LEDEPDPLEGLNVLLMVEPRPEVEREVETPVREVEVPVLDEEEVEDEEELEEELGSPISNAPVSESVVVTSPIGEAWMVYPEPAGTTGMTTVMVPSAVFTTFFKANVLRKMSLVR